MQNKIQASVFSFSKNIFIDINSISHRILTGIMVYAKIHRNENKDFYDRGILRPEGGIAPRIQFSGSAPDWKFREQTS